jgi:hypothetical protein
MSNALIGARLQEETGAIRLFVEPFDKLLALIEQQVAAAKA